MANNAHAEHNEKLSVQLFEGKAFLDWANTTAFYSSLHYVKGIILPARYNNIDCSTTMDAAKALNCTNKHEATMEMVKLKLPDIADDYKFLMDCSFTARYYDYQVDNNHAKICQKKLKKIRDACIAAVPKAPPPIPDGGGTEKTETPAS